jgi:outer membrane protein assembly factor BamB
VSAPSINADHIVVQTANGHVFDLNTANGEQRWRFDSAMPALTLRGNSRPQFFANYAVIGLANGKLAIIDIETGQLLWEPKVAEPKGDTEIERIVDIDGTPIVLGDKLYAASYQGQLVAYELKSGRLLWAEEESSYRDLSAGFGNIYVSSADGVVTAYDQLTGTVKWANDDFLRRRLTAPAAVSNYIVVADYEGYVHVLSQVDGHIVARKRVNGSGVKTSIMVDDTRFYVIANNGRLKAYELGEEIK